MRSEADAFRLVIGGVLLAGASILVGFLAGPVWGAVLFGVVVVVALAAAMRVTDRGRPRRLKVAAESPHPEAPRAKHRILVVANEVLEGPAIRDEIMGRVQLWPELHIVAPILSSRSHYWTDDFDRERVEAQRRLDAMLAWALEQGLEAHGEVGDPDPITAIEDALRRVGADEIIVAAHPPESSNWLESGVVEHIRAELQLPVTHVVIGSAGVSVESSIPHEPLQRLPEKPVISE